MRQGDRAQVRDLGQRAAGEDEVAQVPEAAAEQGRHEPPAQRRPPPAGRRQRHHGDGQRRRHRQHGHLCPGGEADRQPGGGQRPADREGTPPLPPLGLGGAVLRPGVDEDRDRRQQQGARGEVVLRRPGLAHYQRVALEQDRRGGHGEVAAAVGAPDAPGGEESESKPSEVDEQRERVPAGQQDPDRVQQLRVLRVEPVGEDRVRVVHPGHGVALHHVDGEGQVVPERVEVEDASVQGLLGGQAPVSEDHSYDADCDHEGQGAPAGGSCRRGGGASLHCALLRAEGRFAARV